MNVGNDLETLEVVRAQHPGAVQDEVKHEKRHSSSFNSSSDVTATNGYETPTAEEMKTLRRISGKIPWSAYTIAFVELCERFSYYGTTAVFVNFIQQPLPPGSNTGAGRDDYQSGALGMGQRASTGLTLL
jgi:POT family proton-dependent oligopeptide transporter